MGGQVIRLPSRGDTLLTKKQLATLLGRSERWVELKVKEGCPSSRRRTATAGGVRTCAWSRHGSTKVDHELPDVRIGWRCWSAR